MRYKIIIDSCGELLDEWKKDECFESIPLTLMVGAEQIIDDETFDQAEFIDLMMLSGKKTSNAVGGLYVNVVKHCPHLFGLVYRLGRLISSAKRKSPVYFACARLGKKLKQYLENKDFEIGRAHV